VRVLDVLRNTHAPTASWSLLPHVVGATALVVFAGTYVVVFGGPGMVYVDAPFGAGLWYAWIAAAAGWWTARAAGAVDPGSGAGLIVALFGLVCRLRGTWHALLIGTADSDSPAVRNALAFAALHRNLGLVAFGLGLGLVLAACLSDAVRRRRDPRWTRPEG
jgi:hypothetical protein